MSVVDYDTFVASKLRRKEPAGFEPRDIFNDVFNESETDAQYLKRRCDYHEIRGVRQTT